MKRIVIVGATSAIAEHCARLWLPADLVLLGRDARKLQHIADDLSVRSPQSTLQTLTLDFSDTQQIQQIVQQITNKQAVDIVLIAHGMLPEQTFCQQNLPACASALQINAISPVLFAEAFANTMQQANTGTLILIGSVAGDRGRKSNYVYGAAKGLVTRYAQGLQHRLATSNVQVVLVKPGPTDTPMTAHLKSQGARLAPVESVAQQIVQGAAQGKRVIYTPGKWALIMWVIRHLPNWIFNKLDI